MTRWHTYTYTVEPWPLRHAPGCYVFICDGKLTYIGQSVDVANRIRKHDIQFPLCSTAIDTAWGRFDTVTLKVRYADRFGDWLMREARLIRRLQPSGNRKGVRQCQTA